MNVKELIAHLKKFHPSMPVRIAQPTHNHWRQVVAAEIESVQVRHIEWSDYLEADKVLDGIDGPLGNETVLVLE